MKLYINFRFSSLAALLTAICAGTTLATTTLTTLPASAVSNCVNLGFSSGSVGGESPCPSTTVLTLTGTATTSVQTKPGSQSQKPSSLSGHSSTVNQSSPSLSSETRSEPASHRSGLSTSASGKSSGASGRTSALTSSLVIVIGGSTLPVPSSTTTYTLPDGSTAIIGPSGILEGSQTIRFPSGPTTLATSGLTLTFGEVSTRKTVPGPSGSTLRTATGTAATGKPAITPPPSGNPGAIPTVVPTSGPLEPSIAITLSSGTFALPHTISVNLLQSDGSTITFFPDSIIHGTATVSVPSLSSQTTLSLGGLTIEAGPQQQGTADSGGANGRDGLLNALESLAGTANSIVNTLDKIGDQGVLWAAGSSSTSAFTDAVSGLFDSAVTDLSHFTTSFGATFEDFDAEVYELTDDGLRRIFPAREGGIEALDILQSLQKLTHNLANLRNEVILEIKAYWKQGTAAAAALAGTEEALRKFGSFDWTTLKKHARPSTISTSTKTGSSTSSSSSSATPTPFFFMTKYGTALSVFQQYLKTLPDNGQGHQIVYPHVPWQSYFTNLTTKEAQDVASQSFIYFVTAVVPTGNDHDQQVGVPRESGIRKRINENGNLDERLNSDQHLRVLSVANQESLDSNNLPNYLYDPLLGLGQTIYVLDGGFDKDHSDFQPPLDAPNRQVREHVVPNEYTLARELDRSKWGPESLEDWTGHGTAVASVAAGLRHGVASNADLVLVKYKNVAEQPNGNMQLLKATEPAVSDAWEWIISDVQSRRITGYTGKAVVVMPGGLEYLPGTDAPKFLLRSGMNEIMQNVLRACEQYDIIFVVATGNEGDTGITLDMRTPQVLGTTAGPLITVGGVYPDGLLDTITVPDNNEGGSISVYAVSKGVVHAAVGGFVTTATNGGTSLAAPAVAGLAAYFASLPSLAGEWREGSVGTDMKRYITRYAYQRRANPLPANIATIYDTVPPANSIIVAYNRAPDELCAASAPPKRGIHNSNESSIASRQDSGDVPVVVSGKIVATSLSHSYCAAKSSPTTSKGTTTKKPASTSNFETLTGLPTLPPASYCTEILSNGRVELHTKTGSTCTYNTVKPTTSTTTSAAPTSYVDKGLLSCGTRTDQGNGAYFFTLGDAIQARNKFCSNMTNNDPIIVMKPGSDVWQTGTYTPPDDVNNTILVSAKWGALDDTNCPTVRFDGPASYRLCQDRLGVPINDCDIQSHGDEFWKQGGKFFRDCITWEITSNATFETED